MEGGRFAEAAVLFGQAIDVSPANHRYLGNLAYAYTRLRDFKKAVEVYKSLLRLDTRVIQPYLELANAYRLNNQLEAASQVLRLVAPMLEGDAHFEVAKNKHPWYFPTGGGRILLTDPAAKRIYAYLSISATFFLQDKTEEASAHVERAKSHRGNVAAEAALTLISHDLQELNKLHDEHNERIVTFRAIHLQAGSFRED